MILVRCSPRTVGRKNATAPYNSISKCPTSVRDRILLPAQDYRSRSWQRTERIEKRACIDISFGSPLITILERRIRGLALRMSKGSTRNAGTCVHCGTAHAFLLVAIAAICLSLIAHFKLVWSAGSRDSLERKVMAGSFSQLAQPSPECTAATVIRFLPSVRFILTFGGITADPTILSKLGTKFPDNLRNTRHQRGHRQSVDFQGVVRS